MAICLIFDVVSFRKSGPKKKLEVAFRKITMSNSNRDYEGRAALRRCRLLINAAARSRATSSESSDLSPNSQLFGLSRVEITEAGTSVDACILAEKEIIELHSMLRELFTLKEGSNCSCKVTIDDGHSTKSMAQRLITLQHHAKALEADVIRKEATVRASRKECGAFFSRQVAEKTATIRESLLGEKELAPDAAAFLELWSTTTLKKIRAVSQQIQSDTYPDHEIDALAAVRQSIENKELHLKKSAANLMDHVRAYAGCKEEIRKINTELRRVKGQLRQMDRYIAKIAE